MQQGQQDAISTIWTVRVRRAAGHRPSNWEPQGLDAAPSGPEDRATAASRFWQRTELAGSSPSRCSAARATKLWVNSLACPAPVREAASSDTFQPIRPKPVQARRAEGGGPVEGQPGETQQASTRHMRATASTDRTPNKNHTPSGPVPEQQPAARTKRPSTPQLGAGCSCAQPLPFPGIRARHGSALPDATTCRQTARGRASSRTHGVRTTP